MKGSEKLDIITLILEYKNISLFYFLKQLEEGFKSNMGSKKYFYTRIYTKLYIVIRSISRRGGPPAPFDIGGWFWKRTDERKSKKKTHTKTHMNANDVDFSHLYESDERGGGEMDKKKSKKSSSMVIK